MLHHCCFTGHRPEKLNATEEEVRRWLERQIDLAVAEGYTTFITGCARGVDIWAGQIVIRKREVHPELRLIAASPWPGVADRWEESWKKQYQEMLGGADQVVYVCNRYCRSVYQIRNMWMVDRSDRLIAFYNGTCGGTRNTILYARRKGLEIILSGDYPPWEDSLKLNDSGTGLYEGMD